MRFSIVPSAATIGLAMIGVAQGAPSLDIHGVAARVVVIPEARGDVSATVLENNPRLPLRIARSGDKLIISGDIGRHVHGCPALKTGRAVEIHGRGLIAVSDLPRIAIRTPMDVHIAVGEAVFGAIGRTDRLELTNRGCGDWLIGNVKGHMKLNETGSGAARAGSAGSADLSVEGTGGISTRGIMGGLTAISDGAGNIDIASVSGPLNLRIAGPGDIRIQTGDASGLSVAIAGSGSVRFGGVARTLNASIVGRGDARVARVTGSVTKRVLGGGQVLVGPENPTIAPLATGRNPG